MNDILTTLSDMLREILPQGFPFPVLMAAAALLALSFAALFTLFFILFLHTRKKVKEDNKQISELNSDLREHELRNARLATQLETDQKLFREKLGLLHEARDELKLQFEHLASRIFEEKSQRFSELSRERLDTILAPFNLELGELRKEINDIYTKDTRERYALKEEIAGLQELNRNLGKEAHQLTQALKNDNKTLGNWGELVLERLLELSGLRKDIEFSTQESLRNSDGQLFRPDVIIHLPDEREIIIDAKSSLLAWNKAIAAENHEEYKRSLQELVVSLRNHIKGLTEKHYTKLQGLHSLDFVLMFIPIEAAFASACQFDQQLIDDALRQNIIIVSPTTLLTSLRTIENLWKFDRQNKNAREIARRAARLYDKFRGFLEEMEALGKQLTTARNSYDSALNKLCRGQGNLVSQAEQLKDLGIQPKGELPKNFLQQAETSEK